MAHNTQNALRLISRDVSEAEDDAGVVDMPESVAEAMDAESA